MGGERFPLATGECCGVQKILKIDPGFLLVFYRNFVPNMHRFFKIFAFSNTVTLKGVRGDRSGDVVLRL